MKFDVKTMNTALLAVIAIAACAGLWIVRADHEINKEAYEQKLSVELSAARQDFDASIQKLATENATLRKLTADNAAQNAAMQKLNIENAAQNAELQKVVSDPNFRYKRALNP